MLREGGIDFERELLLKSSFTKFSQVDNLLGILDVNLLFAKACDPMVVTDFGIITEFNKLQ